jgi:hypothetical protein
MTTGTCRAGKQRKSDERRDKSIHRCSLLKIPVFSSPLSSVAASRTAPLLPVIDSYETIESVNEERKKRKQESDFQGVIIFS